MDGTFDGAKLREIRLAKGIRQSALAKEIGRSRSYLCDLERGRSSPALDTLVRLAKALDVDNVGVFLGSKK